MKRRQQHPRGIALMLVVAVLALVSALSYAMLNAATLQNRSGGNHRRLATADYLAESGLNLALYYLQYPDHSPTVSSTPYWTGTNGDMTLSSSIAGTVNVTVTQDPTDSWSYEIICVAKAGADSETKVTKTTGARVYVRNEYVVKRAAIFNHNTIIPSNCTVTGDVYSSKSLAITRTSPASFVYGDAYCRSAVISPITTYKNPEAPGAWKILTNPPAMAPAGTSELNLYQTYSIEDVTYSCDTITAASLGTITRNPTASNPAGVLYKNGNLVLSSDTVINGTLVVQGDLSISGANCVITAKNDFPALIVTGNLRIFQPMYSLTVNGVCYVGTAIHAASSGTWPAGNLSRLTIDGGLLLGNTGSANFTAAGTYNVVTNIKYTASKAKAPELTPVQRTPKGVSIVRWGLP